MLGAVKQAQDLLEKRSGIVGTGLSKLFDVGKGLGGAALGYGIPAAIAAPPVLGGLAGYGLARAGDISDQDVAAIKDQEVMDEYHRQTERLKRQKAMRAAQGSIRPGRALL